jgi:hypothetical protein
MQMTTTEGLPGRPADVPAGHESDCCAMADPYNRRRYRVAGTQAGGLDLLARSFGILFGYILACVAFAIVIVSFVFTPAELVSLPSNVATDRLSMAGTHVLLSATQVAIIAAPLAIVAVLIAEWRGIRKWPYYAAVALMVAVVGFLAQYVSELQGQPTIVNNYALVAFLCGGLVAGVVYWLVVGRTAGGKRAASIEETSPPDSTPDPEKA